MTNDDAAGDVLAKISGLEVCELRLCLVAEDFRDVAVAAVGLADDAAQFRDLLGGVDDSDKGVLRLLGKGALI